MQTLKIPPICWLVLSIIISVIYVIGLSVYPSLVHSYFYQRAMTVAYFITFLLWTTTIGLLPHNRIVKIHRIMLFSLIFLCICGVIIGMMFLLKEVPNLIEPKISFLYIAISFAVVIISYILVFLLDIFIQYNIDYYVIHESSPFLTSCVMTINLFIVAMSRFQFCFSGVLLLKSILSIFRLCLMQWLTKG